MALKTKAIIEMPTGSIYKYELDKETNQLVLDRVLGTWVPCNYGFIPNSLSPDGDALDIFVMSEVSILPLTRVSVEIMGVFKCVDNGEEDDKLVARVVGEGPWGSLEIESIRRYLETYKEGFKVLGFFGEAEAAEILAISLNRWTIEGKL